MPEFIGRPNLPNSLANSLVQLAAAETDPLAVALGQVGKIADQYSAYKDEERLLNKKAELQESAAAKGHERTMEIQKSAQEASLYQSLMGNGDFVSAMIKKNGSEGPTAQDLGVGDIGYKSGVRSEASGGRSTPPRSEAGPSSGAVRTESGFERNPEGINAADLGLSGKGDLNYVSNKSKEKIKIDAGVAKKYNLPETTIGKYLTMDQVISMRRSDVSAGKVGAGGRGSAQYAQYLKIAVSSLPTESTADEISAYADDLYEAAVQSQSKPGSVPKPPAKTEATKKKGFSLFGFLSTKSDASEKPTPKKDDAARRAELKASLAKKGIGGKKP